MEKHVLDYKKVFLQALQGKGGVKEGLAFEETLEPGWFDFSLESLYYIDSYLFSIFISQDNLQEKQMENTIWATGFYLGEVIRRNADKEYQWKNWSEFFPYQKEEVQEMHFQTMGTSALLVDEAKQFILPIGQVIKFLKEGPANSLHFFASQEIETANV